MYLQSFAYKSEEDERKSYFCAVYMKKAIPFILFLLVSLTMTMTHLSAQNNAADELPYTLSSPHPNPFKDATSIQFTLRKSGFVSMKVFNLLGNEVGIIINEIKNPGTYFATFEARHLPKGIYFCRFSFGNHSTTRKLIIAD